MAARAPKHLSEAARKIWNSVVKDYELEPRHLELLRLALEALDAAEKARQTIASEGQIVDGGRYGKKAHPCIAIERDSRIAHARLMRELGLDLENPAASRPPSRWRA